MLTGVVYGQRWQNMPQPGYGPIKQLWVDSNLVIPTATLTGTLISGGRAIGQLRYNESDSSLQAYTGYQWLNQKGSGGSSSGWSLTGNAGTTAVTNFIGTTDNVDLVFKRYNIISGRIGESTSFGMESLLNNAGTENTAFGVGTLKTNTSGIGNEAFGNNALNLNETGTGNTAIGGSALLLNNSGSNNVAIGGSVLSETISTNNNTGIGVAALALNTGTGNIGIGFSSGKYNTTLSNRLFINSLNRTNILGDTTQSIIYGVQDATAANQRLYLNAKVIAPYLPTAVGLYSVRADADGNLSIADTTSGGSGTVTSIATTSPMTGGIITTTGTIGINNAAADGSTKGAASFTANDFNASTGNISIDYTNGQASSGSTKGFLSSTDWTTFNNKGNVTKVGTPVNNQIGVWTGDGTIKGVSTLTYDGISLVTSGASTGTGTTFSSTTSGFYPAQFFSSGNDAYVTIGKTVSLNNAGAFHFNSVGTNSTSNSLRFGFASNFDLMTLQATGSVGIGTTSPGAQLHTTGTVRLANFGAGTATFDASGNVSSVSDERLKNIQGYYRSGLKDLMKIKPIFFKWNEKSGMETEENYIGFSAQNIKETLGDGSYGVNKDGYLSIQDRAIMATMINAIKEMQAEIEDLKNKLKNK